VRESRPSSAARLTAAEGGGRNGSIIEILILLSLARRACGDVAGALASLARALDLAEPEGHVRVFADEGAPMVALLKLAARQPETAGYARRLLGAVVSEERTPVEQALIEPLSERELEVLRLLESDLDGPEIARELLVSLNTLRTHTKSIYSKLGVTSRRAAVSRAAELGLLSRTRDRRRTS
jgi:LuxR family maltose regulon positive regulatory protein